jgi:hypothetical protein
MRSSLLIAVSACLTVGLMASVTAGCGSGSSRNPDAAPDPGPAPDAGGVELLAESLAAWQDMKAADDGTYGYTRTSLSFTGFHSTTRFVVADDVVVRRTFEGYDENDQLVESFDEQGDEVGSNQGAAPVYTIDELYEVCRDGVLTQDPEANQLFLGFLADGILDHCLYVPNDCADDCSMGVDIESIDLSL